MKSVPKTLALIASFGIVVSACGGGGSSGGSSVPSAAVGGWWTGTTTISGQGQYELLGLVAEDGRGIFIQEDGVMYWGTVKSSGSQITANLTGAALLGETLWDGSASGTGSVTGAIQERASISANSTFTTARGGRTTSTISLDYEALYDDDSSLALIAGNYVDALGFYSGVLNVASNGDIFLQDPDSGCVINGRISIINSAYNAYDIQYSYSGCTGFDSVLNGVAFRGLASYDAGIGEMIALVHGSVGGNPYPDVFIFDRA